MNKSLKASAVFRLAALAAALVLPVATAAASSCELNSPGGKIQHVIYIQFDNTHLLRDNPKVPSDLEQMPHLLSFIKNSDISRSDLPNIGLVQTCPSLNRQISQEQCTRAFRQHQLSNHFV